MKLEEINIVPDLLLKNGFIEYHPGDEDKNSDITLTYPHNLPEGDRVFMERDFHRNLFVVVFCEEFEINGDLDIYVLEDAGCDFVCMPLRWSNLNVEFFNSLYYAFMGENKITVM